MAGRIFDMKTLLLLAAMIAIGQGNKCWFKCTDDGKCTTKIWECDERVNVNRLQKIHPCENFQYMFFCHHDYISCNAKRWICNGEVDCPNGFDEKAEICEYVNM